MTSLSTGKKRSRGVGRSSSTDSIQAKVRRVTDADGSVWTVRHKPVDSAALAVHFKKVEEVRAWLRAQLKHGHKPKRNPGILLLTGPSGCGKTATIRALSSELNFEISEWSVPNEVVAFERRDDDYGFVAPDDSVPYTSQTRAFRNFMLRASRYSLLDGLGKTGKVVLIEELPTFALKDSREFHSVLTQYKSSSAGAFPLVIIVSESGAGGRDDFLRHLFSPESVAALGISTVAFNPVAPTNLVKCLKSIAAEESTASGRQFAVPDDSTLMALAEASGGDVRGAINALQFACLQGSGSLRSCVDTSAPAKTQPTSKKLRRHGSADKLGQALAPVGAKDPSLDLFHGLGKVLYCKRNEEDAPSERLPTALAHARRKPLKSSPEDILERAPVSEETFTGFLQQNYPGFFSDIVELSNAAESLSISEPFFTQWTNSGKVSLSEYGGLVAIRGLCFHNEHVAKMTGMKTFHKSDWYQSNKKNQSRSLQLANAFRMSGLPRGEITTLLAPALLQLCPGCVPADLHDLSKYTGMRQQQRPLLQANSYRPQLNATLTVIEEDTEEFVIEEVD